MAMVSMKQNGDVEASLPPRIPNHHPMNQNDDPLDDGDDDHGCRDHVVVSPPLHSHRPTERACVFPRYP